MYSANRSTPNMSQVTIEDVLDTEYIIDVDHSLNHSRSGGDPSNIIMVPRPTTCGGDPLV